MASVSSLTDFQPDSIEQLQATFKNHRVAYTNNPMSSLAERLEKLAALKSSILKNQQALIDAMSLDFGHRSEYDTLIGDILPVINQIKYTTKKLKKWLKPSRRHAGLLLTPATVRVEYQPKGVVGIIAPWNFPIMLSLSPLVTSIAAGNHTMIKMSEFTPKTNKVLARVLSELFSDDFVSIIEGEVDVATAFSELPFDHILFTGSTPVGKHVMKAAASNLTPVTLELGGKSPVIIGDDMPITDAIERLIYGKCLNAGQICVSPDYILCPEQKVEQFIQTYREQFQSLYPSFESNNDYSDIINQRQAERLTAVYNDALAKGAKVYSAHDNSSPLSCDSESNTTALNVTKRKWPTQLITNVSDTMLLMQQEIFGPLLPLIPYRTFDEAIDYVNQHDRPLALYLMSYNKDIQKRVLKYTHSGGVCINETVFHVAAEDAPFGGIGPSGLGHYHGFEGFQTLSHAKTVLQRGRFNTGKLIQPPYGGYAQKLLLKLFLR